MTTHDTMGRVVPYDASKHEGFVLESWVRSWARSRAGVQLGVDNQNGSKWNAFFDEYRGVAMLLLASERVDVVVDSADESIIWAWSARSRDNETVHDVIVKRELTKPGDALGNADAVEMVNMLVGDLIGKRTGHTGELASMRVLGMWPTAWFRDGIYIWRKLWAHVDVDDDLIREGRAA